MSDQEVRLARQRAAQRKKNKAKPQRDDAPRKEPRRKPARITLRHRREDSA